MIRKEVTAGAKFWKSNDTIWIYERKYSLDDISALVLTLIFLEFDRVELVVFEKCNFWTVDFENAAAATKIL